MDRGIPNIDTDEGAGQQPGGETHPGMPRWVKAFVVVGALLLVLIVVMRVTGGGGHGPGRHGAPQDTETPPPATIQESAPDGQLQPDGGTDSVHDPSRWGH